MFKKLCLLCVYLLMASSVFATGYVEGYIYVEQYSIIATASKDNRIANLRRHPASALRRLTIFRRRNIGFVFQQYNLVPMLNVWENIVLPVKLDGKKVEKGYVDEIIDTLGIRTKLENLPSALSGGQQQRVAIARALAAKPAILLADEPTGNLDSKTSQDVLGLLKVTSKRFHQTIVMITHNEEIAQMADRILQIEDGKIVSDSGLV